MKHGYTINGAMSPTYIVWRSMRNRCLSPKNKAYPYYGGRGIKVCQRWINFENFLADMGEKPGGLTIERINNNGDYEPDNCKWASRKEQQRNTRSSKLLEYAGLIMSVPEWSELLHINLQTIKSRLRYGWTLELAFFTNPLPTNLRAQHGAKRRMLGAK